MNCPTCHARGLARTLDDIGDDTIGRRYLWCAECATELLLSPDEIEERERQEIKR